MVLDFDEVRIRPSPVWCRFRSGAILEWLLYMGLVHEAETHAVHIGLRVTQ